MLPSFKQNSLGTIRHYHNQPDINLPPCDEKVHRTASLPRMHTRDLLSWLPGWNHCFKSQPPRPNDEFRCNG
jgi:hypothetical protein